VNRTASAKKVQDAPRLASAEALRGKRLIDMTSDELVEAVLDRLPDVLIAYLEGAIKPPLPYLTRAECAELLRISTAQLDLLSRREADPIPFELCGDSRRFVRTEVHAWLQRQRKAGER
jgi:predicted DNA-binding transcriptional regulator AlpA